MSQPVLWIFPLELIYYNSINDLIRKGAGILSISSDIEEILGMGDRILVLYGGQIVCDLKRTDASKEKILAYTTGEFKA